MQHVKKKDKSRSRELLFCLGMILIFAVTALLSILTVDRSQFKKGSSIAGIDCSDLTAEEAAVLLEEAIEQKTVRIYDGEDVLLTRCALTELIGDVDTQALAGTFLKEQNSSPGLLARRGTYTVSFARSAGELEPVLKSLLCGEDYVAQEPEDACLVMDESGPHIQPETRGNIYDLAACSAAVEAALAGDFSLANSEPLEITVENALKTAEVRSDDARLQTRLAALEQLTSLDITLEFCGGRSYTLTTEDIVDVLDVEFLPYRTRVDVDSEALCLRLDGIIDELGADGVEAKYGNVRSTREYVYLLQKDKGFTLDRDALQEQLTDALLSRQNCTISALYDYTWWLRQTYGWMGNVDNCIEVSVDNQYLWFYKDGILLTETPVTTGDLATLCDTPRGAFRISYRTSDVFLVGPTWNDHVDYWIPFNGDYGLHDSSWRTEYGGDVYLTNGSHGCVNTPLEPMSIVYNNSYTAMPVIVR